MHKSTFSIPKMDCPSEERMVRMKLDGQPAIKSLQFDLPRRQLQVFHSGELAGIENALKELGFGASLLSSESAEANFQQAEEPATQRKLLWAVLLINFGFFLIEMVSGLLAGSMGLIADSLDMLADALVYALSLWAVGSSLVRKKNIARTSGYFQFSLAIIGFAEVLRRFFAQEALPDFRSMIVISLLALLANVLSLYLLQKGKSREAHMQASMIFTSNDIIINAGVILAGFLVHLTDSALPDLLIGAIVFLIVVRGAFRILRLAK